MDKKSFGIGIAVGVLGTGVLNVIGSIVGGVIARKNAKKLADAIIDECNDECGCDTCTCCTESEE